MPTETKKCTRCGVEKTATTEFFSPRKDGRLKLASGCKDCHAAKKRQSYKDPEWARKFDSAHAARRRDRLATDPSYKTTYREKANARRQRLRADPEYREQELTKDRQWRKENWDRVKTYKHKSGAMAAFHAMKRHATKLNATPRWADLDAIEVFYEEARRLTAETGIEHHVDHIYPLRGKTVCGLHVHTNLQILTATENKRKSNKLLPDIDCLPNQATKPPSGGFSFLEDIQCPAT